MFQENSERLQKQQLDFDEDKLYWDGKYVNKMYRLLKRRLKISSKINSDLFDKFKTFKRIIRKKGVQGYLRWFRWLVLGVWLTLICFYKPPAPEARLGTITQPVLAGLS